MMSRLLRNLKHFGYGFLAISLLALAVNSCEPAYADIVSEIGAGIKIRSTTSTVLLPQCHTALPLNAAGQRLYDRSNASCGGDNPAFMGWPIAWEREFQQRQRIKRVRCGWFHLSHWGDGGSDRETHMDAAACTLTLTWRAL